MSTTVSVQRPLLLCCLGLLVLVAGCSTLPLFGQNAPVPVVVNNSANTTQTFEVWVVEYESNVTFHRDDGRAGTTEIGQGLVNYNSGDYHTWEAIDLAMSSKLHGRYTLAPGEEARSEIEEFSPNFAIVIIVYQDENEIISWVSAHCGDGLGGVKVSSYPDPPGGVGAAYLC